MSRSENWHVAKNQTKCFALPGNRLKQLKNLQESAGLLHPWTRISALTHFWDFSTVNKEIASAPFSLTSSFWFTQSPTVLLVPFLCRICKCCYWHGTLLWCSYNPYTGVRVFLPSTSLSMDTYDWWSDSNMSWGHPQNLAQRSVDGSSRKGVTQVVLKPWQEKCMSKCTVMVLTKGGIS